MEDPVEVKDVYFRRFFVPVVIAILILAGIYCIVTDQPGVAPEWNTSNSVFGAQVAGALKKLHKFRR